MSTYKCMETTTKKTKYVFKPFSPTHTSYTYVYRVDKNHFHIPAAKMAHCCRVLMPYPSKMRLGLRSFAPLLSLHVLPLG